MSESAQAVYVIVGFCAIFALAVVVVGFSATSKVSMMSTAGLMMASCALGGIGMLLVFIEGGSPWTGIVLVGLSSIGMFRSARHFRQASEQE